LLVLHQPAHIALDGPDGVKAKNVTDDEATAVRELRRLVGGLSVALARQFRLVVDGDHGRLFSDWATFPVAPVSTVARSGNRRDDSAERGLRTLGVPSAADDIEVRQAYDNLCQYYTGFPNDADALTAYAYQHAGDVY
jgi:hypothetical protein